MNGAATLVLKREAAKVYLLLDYLSGRADRSLRPTEEELARSLLDRRNRAERPDANTQSQPQTITKDEDPRAEIERDLYDPTRLVLRTMRLCKEATCENKELDTTQEHHGINADAAFLMRARDMLNARALPATSETIAFSALVAAHSSSREKGVEPAAEFAEQAYPELIPSARALARDVAHNMWWLLIVLLLALAVSGYTAWGKVLMDTLDAVRSDASPTNTATAEIQERILVTVRQIAQWESPLRWVTIGVVEASSTPEQKHTVQLATAFLTVLGNYVMPILYGCLGAFAFVLRRHDNRLAWRVLSPHDLQANNIRLVLGVLIGGCIGLFYSGSAVAQTTGILGAAATLSTAAIAFLAGYGVEGVFQTLDALIKQVFRVNGTDKPPQTAA